jgi:hypothetical protein
LAKERKLLERGLERGSFSYTTYRLALGFFFLLLLLFGKGLLTWIRVWVRRRCWIEEEEEML